ncbi:MAG TPA: 50S ribosomal protein L29 [Vicinamibacterales bacterium]|jgi:large subunit ribosomal protein L29|nr:50S ribosomal protein L29 [Vicinamibacterales bacterium]
MARIAELRELDTEALRQRERELEEELFRLRLQKSMGQPEAAHRIARLRRDLARVKTLIRERELAAKEA